MSHWLESLYGYGTGHIDPAAAPDVQDDQAFHLLHHFALSVPRAWWEWLLDGRLAADQEQSYASLVREALADLHQLPDRFGSVDAGIVVALAFVCESDLELEALSHLPKAEAVDRLL